MNQGRIWCVVPPAVGLPLIIGGAAVTSLIVHFAILDHTNWMSNYWQGKAAKTADLGSTSGVALSAATNSAFSVSVTPVQGATGGTSFVVTVTPSAANSVVGSADAGAVVSAAEPAK